MGKQTKASDLLVRCLEAEGVEYVFGLPGEENLDFLQSLSDSSQIELILTRHEQAAGFMAATYGRLTGKAGVCLATLGPGATNLVTAAAYAQLGGTPMVMITGQKPIKSSKQGKFQILDIVDVMGPITKSAYQIASAEIIPARVREAFRLAEEERPGAVHIELPEDIAIELTSEEPIERSIARRPVADEKAIRNALSLIENSKSPILVLGGGANRTLTRKMLFDFIGKTNIPFVTTQLGKGVVDERHLCFVGCAALSSGDFVHSAINKSDLIITVGHDDIEKPPFFMKPDGPKVIHINHTSASVDPVYFPQVQVVGDIANAIWQLNESLEVQKDWDFTEMLATRIEHLDHSKKIRSDDRFPIFPPYMVRQLRNVMPNDGIITLDNGVYKIWFARGYPALYPNTVLLDNALATMGAGLPSAMAAKMLNPEKKVVSICGDGGFMMNSQEVETAVRLGLNLTVLILNDFGYGMVRWKQINQGFDDFGLSFGNPDFVKYAESYGAKGHRLESAKQFKDLVEQCLETEGVHIIDCPVDYSENDEILNNTIREMSAKI